MAFLFQIEGRDVPVAALTSGEAVRVAVDGRWHQMRLDPRVDGSARLRLDGESEDVHVVVDGDRCFVHLRGEAYEITRVDPIARLREARAAESGELLKAPMPGVVVEIPAPLGSVVAAGDTVVLIESMKLQTALAAHAPGRVAELPFGAGQSFEKGAVLARIERRQEGTG